MSIEHSAITSSDTHEPKHITSSTTTDSGKIITASSTTSGTSEFRKIVPSDIDTSSEGSIFTYWGVYEDSTYTSGSKLTVGASTRTQVTIDGLGSATDTTQYPAGVDLWDTTNNVITPEQSGDGLLVRLTYKCSSSGTSVYVDHELDIGGGIGVTISETRNIIKGSSATNNITISWPTGSGSTFVSNGGTLYITPSSSTDFWDFKVYVARFHKGN